LVFLYNWHDDCVIKLAFYLHNEIRPKICTILGRDDIFTWEDFQHKFRQSSKVLSYPNLGRLIIIVPILISAVGYILIESMQNLNYFKWILIFMDILLIVIILIAFFDVNREYRDLNIVQTKAN